jgi:hypothetical protein
MTWFNIQMGVWYPKIHLVPKQLGYNNGLYAQGAIHHPSSCQFLRHTIFFGLPNFHILELLRDPPWQVGPGRKTDRLTNTQDPDKFSGSTA